LHVKRSHLGDVQLQPAPMVELSASFGRAFKQWSGTWPGVMPGEPYFARNPAKLISTSTSVMTAVAAPKLAIRLQVGSASLMTV
jgi:hypothetical protein